MGVSIIIPAYQAQDFIEECLDSIETQTYFNNNNNYEILLGVDACEETLKKVKEIRHKYRNLYVYMMDSNKGPYITKNTLIPLTRYKKILFFDADDIMMNTMVHEIIGFDEDVVRFNFFNFFKNKEEQIETRMNFAHGVFLIKKKVFNVVGGFLNWRCGADTEFFKRTNNFVKTKYVKSVVFSRRKHPTSLTETPKTKLGSLYREKLRKKIKKKYNRNDLYINPVKNSYKKK